jgi:hypothetical protein
MPGSNPSPLLTVRAAVILALAFVIGASAGLLAAAADQHPATAVLVGLGATGSAILALHKLIAA